MRKILFVTVLFLFAVNSYGQEEFWDPTQPSVGGSYEKNNVSASHGLQLDGIFSQANNSTIIINGKILRVGDSIEGYKITQISKNSVTLQSNSNESFVLKFPDFNFKQYHQ